MFPSAERLPSLAEMAETELHFRPMASAGSVLQVVRTVEMEFMLAPLLPDRMVLAPVQEDKD
jgi:hypothetical protein